MGWVVTHQRGSHSSGALASWKLVLPLNLSSNAINSQLRYQLWPDQASSTGQHWEEMDLTGEDGVPESLDEWSEMELKESLCLSPLHTSQHVSGIQSPPTNFPACSLPSRVILPDCSPPLLLPCSFCLCCPKWLFCLFFFFLAHTFKGYLKLHLPPKIHPSDANIWAEGVPANGARRSGSLEHCELWA